MACPAREQALRANIRHIDAVLITHAHVDHLFGLDDIRRINTVQGERVMRPDFGSNVLDYTFSAASDTLRQSLAFDLREQLGYLEPRIADIEVRCRDTDELEGAIVVEVSYQVRSTNNRYNHVYPFYRTEGSEGGDVI